MAVLKIFSEVTGAVWKIEAEVGDQILADDPIMIVESMKMEIPVTSPRAGRIIEIFAGEGDLVEEGRIVATLEY